MKSFAEVITAGNRRTIVSAGEGPPDDREFNIHAMRNRSPVATGVLIALAVIALLVGLLLLWRAKAVVVLALIALVLMTGIEPVVTRIEQLRLTSRGWTIPRAAAILAVILGAFSVFVGLMIYVLGAAWTEGTQLVQNLPEYEEAIRTWIADLRVRHPQIPPVDDVIPDPQEQIMKIAAYAAASTGAIFGVLGGIVSAITVVVLTFYLTLTRESAKKSFLSIIPPAHRTKVSDTMSEASDKMGGWLRGQLLLAGLVIVVVSGAMWIIGMPYPLMIGLIGGVAELVPLLGPIVAGIVALPIALLTQPGWVSIAVVVFFVVFSQVEGNYLAPRIMRSQVGLSPFITILALFAGGSLLGIVGALLAVPLSAGLRVIIVRLVMPAVRRAGEKQ